ncbi:MAG: hypothetical protein COB16_13770 [Rhodobacteraceae bacterium]|nr:MAG: hypothetical protein COB16_13770 [Paracoccaceae bacterium]
MAKEPLPKKFSLEGQVLIYDTETKVKGSDAEMTIDDIDALQVALSKHPDVTELRLNSSGGSVFAGEEMAWIVIDYGLDTTVSGECVSACVDLFLAGERRRMMLGSKIGFHQRHWSTSSVKNYYDNWKEDEGWDNPFDFGSWIYGDTQSEIYQHLTYLVERGVDAGFAIETLRVESNGEWYPSRLKLIASGVLRENPVAN